MKERTVSTPDLIMIAGTRVALGLGLGLLLAGRLNRDQRKAAGWALFAAGVLTSVPIALGMAGKEPVQQEPTAILVA
jgi:fructose-specific phosphotransferase system IIC component